MEYSINTQPLLNKLNIVTRLLSDGAISEEEANVLLNIYSPEKVSVPSVWVPENGYYGICGCNPENGGTGICNCILGGIKTTYTE